VQSSTEVEVDPYSVLSFEDFWPHYVRLHTRPETQWIHALATCTSIVLLTAAVTRKSVILAAVSPFANHLIAQSSHRIFEANQSTPWKNQLWHTRAELRMLRLVLSGKMAKEVALHAS